MIILEYIKYIILIVILVIIALAISKSKKKSFKYEANKLIEYLGGEDNIVSTEFNKSRFVVNLLNVDIVNKDAIQRMGAKGIVEIDNQLKIILGEDAKQLEENEFFIADLIGLEVYQNEFIGIIDDVFQAGGSDVYVIKRKGKKDLLLPAIESVIKKIDIEGKRIDVEIPRGLDDDEV